MFNSQNYWSINKREENLKILIVTVNMLSLLNLEIKENKMCHCLMRDLHPQTDDSDVFSRLWRASEEKKLPTL